MRKAKKTRPKAKAKKKLPTQPQPAPEPKRVPRTLFDLWSETFETIGPQLRYVYRCSAIERDRGTSPSILSVESLVLEARQYREIVFRQLNRYCDFSWSVAPVGDGTGLADRVHRAADELQATYPVILERLAEKFIELVHQIPADRLPAFVAEWRALKCNQPGTWRRWRWATEDERTPQRNSEAATTDAG